MSSNTPSVTVKVGDVEHKVVFTVGKLIEIEKAMKSSIFQIASRTEPNVEFMCDFVAVCLNISRNDVIDKIKPSEIFTNCGHLLRHLGEAASQFLPSSESANPQTAQSEAPSQS